MKMSVIQRSHPLINAAIGNRSVPIKASSAYLLAGASNIANATKIPHSTNVATNTQFNNMW